MWTPQGGGNKVLDLAVEVRYISVTLAGIAQLVERNLAKVDVAGSSPVSRSVPNPVEGVGTSVRQLSSTLFVRTSSMNLPRCHKLPPGNGVFFLARYPSGKGEVCKTFMRRFDPGPRLKKKLGKMEEVRHTE